MNYERVYNQIIENAKLDEPNRKGMYTERHHIIPRCMGGTNEKSNLVKLTAREHFLCHWLLWKQHRTPKLGFAFNCMRFSSKSNQQRVYTSFEYECMSIANAEASRLLLTGKARPELSERNRGKNNPFYGKHHSEETKAILSEKRKGKSYWDKVNPEWKEKFYKMASAPKSEEHKAKIGRKGYKNLRNIHTNEVIRVFHTDERCSSPDWVSQNKGRELTKSKVCEYCGLACTTPNYNRWHGKNCKHNPDNLKSVE